MSAEPEKKTKLAHPSPEEAEQQQLRVFRSQSPDEAKKKFAMWTAEQLHVNEEVAGASPVGNSATELFFSSDNRNGRWAEIGSLPPPSFFFPRDPPELKVYFVSCGGELPSCPSSWIRLELGPEKKIEWSGAKSFKHAVVLLQPGTFRPKSLNLAECPHGRVEIIGASENRNSVLIKEPKGEGGVGINFPPSATSMVELRLCNLIVEQVNDDSAIAVCVAGGFVELDTVKVETHMCAVFLRNGDCFLRNATIRAGSEAVDAGGNMLVVVNSSLVDCLYDNSPEMILEMESEGDELCGAGAITLKSYTNFLFWNSQIVNSHRHAIHREGKREAMDEKTIDEMVNFSNSLDPLVLQQIWGDDPASAIKALQREEAERKDGVSVLRGANIFKDNEACGAECSRSLTTGGSGHCLCLKLQI